MKKDKTSKPAEFYFPENTTREEKIKMAHQFCLSLVRKPFEIKEE